MKGDDIVWAVYRRWRAGSPLEATCCRSRQAAADEEERFRRLGYDDVYVAGYSSNPASEAPSLP